MRLAVVLVDIRRTPQESDQQTTLQLYCTNSLHLHKREVQILLFRHASLSCWTTWASLQLWWRPRRTTLAQKRCYSLLTILPSNFFLSFIPVSSPRFNLLVFVPGRTMHSGTTDSARSVGDAILVRFRSGRSITPDA